MKYVRWFMIGTICLALVALTSMVWKNSAELKRLVTFTTWYSGYDVGSEPTFDVPRLPPTKNLEFVGHLGGRLNACALRDNLAAFSTGPELHLYDLGDLKNPVELGKIMLLGKIEEISFSQDGKSLFIADGRGGLRIIDVTDPKALKEVATYGHRGAVEHVLQRNDLLYVASKLDGMKILKRENNKLRLIKYDDNVNHPNGSYEIGNMCSNQDFLVSSDTVNGLRLMLLKDPEFPVLSGKHTMPHVSPDYVGCDQNIAVVASSKLEEKNEQEIRIFDLTGCGAREATPIKLPNFRANGLCLRDKRAYVFGNKGIVALDITEISAPKIDTENGWQSTSPVLTLAMEGNKACATTQDGRFIVFQLKERPEVMSTKTFPNNVLSTCVDKGTGQLFIGAKSGVFASSLSNVTSFARLGEIKNLTFLRVDKGKLAAKTDESLELWNTGYKLEKLSSVPCQRLTSPPVPFQNDFWCGGEKGVVSTVDDKDNHLKEESVDAIAGDGKVLVTAPSGYFSFQIFNNKSTSPKEAKFVHAAMHQSVLDAVVDKGLIYFIQGPFLRDNKLFVVPISEKVEKLPEFSLRGGRRLCANNGLIAAEEIGFVGVFRYDGKEINRIAEMQSTAVPLSISDMQMCGNLVLISGQENGLYVYLVKE
ncbi:MAG: hypothetical protein SFY67_11155 [Candidatus Melainabacteria bacterium]|nr:hypothetical protein [Candidatus Melainabacteria bacterium]